MFTSWNHLDYLVRLDSQLALCLGTFWVLLRHHPATLTFHLGLELCTISYRAFEISACWRPLRFGQLVTWSGVGQKTLLPDYPRALSPRSRLLHYWASPSLGTIARHRRAKSPKSDLLYMEPPCAKIYGSWVKKWKIENFQNFVFDQIRVILRSNGVISGHSRSLKVTQGHSRSNYSWNSFKIDYFKI